MTIRTAVGGASATLDSTGMTFIAVFTATVGSQVVSDNQSNTWTALTSYFTSTGMHGRWSYVANPTTNASHTFSQPQSFSSIFVIATDEVDVSGSPIDVSNGNNNNSNVTSLAVGSITTTNSDSFIVAGVAHSADSNSPTSGYSVDSSFTLDQSRTAIVGVRIGGAVGHRVVSSTLTTNPSFSWSAANPTSGAIAAFKGAGSGGVSVNLTGQAITSARGTLTPALAVPITGQSVSFSLGTLSPSVAQSVTLTGLSFSASQGTLVPATSVPLAGNSFTASFGNLSTGNDVLVALAGLSITASRGTLTPSSAIPLTGRSATFSRGTLVPVASGPVTVNLTGLSFTLAKGTVGTAAGNIPRSLTFTFANRNITINKKNLKITGSFSTKKSKFTFEGN